MRGGLPAALEEAENQRASFRPDLFLSLYEELAPLDERIEDADNPIRIAFQNRPDCRRIAALEGVRPLIAPAIVAGRISYTDLDQIGSGHRNAPQGA